MYVSKPKSHNPSAFQYHIWSLLFLNLTIGYSCSKPKSGSKHFDHYVIEVFATNANKEPLDGTLSVEVQTSKSVDISPPEDIIPAILHNGKTTTYYTRPHRGNQIADNKVFPLGKDGVRGRYFLVFPPRIKRQDIKTIKFFIEENNISKSELVLAKWKSNIFDFSKENISSLQPLEQNIKHSASSAPCEKFQNPVGNNAIHFLWNFITAQGTAYAFSKSVTCKLTFRSRDQIHLVFEKI